MNMLRHPAGGSRLTIRPALLAAALVTLAPSAAWARPVPAAAVPDSVTVTRNRVAPTVQVENNNWLDVRVYVVRNGEPISLGFVTGPGHAQLTLPMMATVPGADVQILVLPIGGVDSYLSPSLTVNPGDVLDLSIQNALALSTVTVAPGR
jgi:hypothetical protein